MSRVRWASQRRRELGESSGGVSGTQCVESDTNVMDSTTTKQWEGGESSGEASVTQCVESDINVMDSTTNEQWEGGEMMGKQEG